MIERENGDGQHGKRAQLVGDGGAHRDARDDQIDTKNNLSRHDQNAMNGDNPRAARGAPALVRAQRLDGGEQDQGGGDHGQMAMDKMHTALAVQPIGQAGPRGIIALALGR